MNNTKPPLEEKILKEFDDTFPDMARALAMSIGGMEEYSGKQRLDSLKKFILSALSQQRSALLEEVEKDLLQQVYDFRKVRILTIEGKKWDQKMTDGYYKAMKDVYKDLVNWFGTYRRYPSPVKTYEKDYSHSHCWNQDKEPACGQPLEKHTQCCLCAVPFNPSTTL